jgi:tRNA G10  N-methylase Trm11
LFLGGELSDDSVAQARANVAWTRTQSFQACTDIEGNRKKHLHNVEIVQWNAGRIPLRDRSVDIIICDMPFGMKHGNYRQNRKLYPIFFSEVARILSENGKVV